MLRDRAFQVKMVKDADSTTPPIAPDYEALATHMAGAGVAVMREVSKVAAVTLIVHTGCKIAASWLSK